MNQHMKKELNKLIKELCEAEGLKSQIKVGDMRELMGKLADRVFKDESVETFQILLEYGKSRAAKAKA